MTLLPKGGKACQNGWPNCQFRGGSASWGEDLRHFTKRTSPRELARIRIRPKPRGIAISFCNSLHELHFQKTHQHRWKIGRAGELRQRKETDTAQKVPALDKSCPNQAEKKRTAKFRPKWPASCGSSPLSISRADWLTMGVNPGSSHCV